MLFKNEVKYNTLCFVRTFHCSKVFAKPIAQIVPFLFEVGSEASPCPGSWILFLSKTTQCNIRFISFRIFYVDSPSLFVLLRD